MQWATTLDSDPKDWTREMFLEVCQQPGVTESLRKMIAQYHKEHPIKILPGLFVDATSTQNDMCRLAALMVEPQLFQFLAAKSDPGQGRSHTDTPALRATALTEAAFQELRRCHNDVNFVPHHMADVSQYSSDVFINIAQPSEARDYVWIASAFQNIKTNMGKFITDFNQSGNLQNDMGDDQRDLIFWNQFCRMQPMWMYIYLLWDHGRHSMLAWNCIVLPASQTMDLGTGPSADAGRNPGVATVPETPPPPAAKKSSSSSKKRHRTEKGDSEDGDASLLQVSRNLLATVSQSTPSTNSRSDVAEASGAQRARAVADHAKALGEHAAILRREIKETEDVEMKTDMENALKTVMRELCMLSTRAPTQVSGS
jgi:hypothetical protein